MSITRRTLKDGSRVYEIRVSRGRDPLTGKQLTPFSKRYTPPATWSDKKAMKEAKIVEAEFIAACKAGEVLTKAEERRHRQEQIEAEEQRQHEEAAKPTFEKYAALYLQRKQGIGSDTTILNYKPVFRRAGAVLNHYRMEDITPAIMKGYMLDLQANGKNEKTGALLGYKSILKHYIALHALFQSAVDNEIIPFSPMQNMKRPKPRKGEAIKQRDAFTEAEVQHILKCACSEPLRWKALIFFALDSGCRRGEIVGLKWEDIDFTTGKVTVNRNAQYAEGKGTYLTTPKNGNSRSFPLNPPALAVLKEWRREQALILLGQGLPQSGFVFTDERGKMINPQAPTSYLRRFGKKYGIKDIHPHKLRHTMATISIANGADIKSVSDKLGHSDVSITLQVYTHANEEAQQRANQALAGAIYKNVSLG